MNTLQQISRAILHRDTDTLTSLLDNIHDLLITDEERHVFTDMITGTLELIHELQNELETC
jgi:hypothetical protein